MIAKRIRVAEIVNGFAIETAGGGAARFGISLAQSLKDDQFEAIVCGLWKFGTPFEELRMKELTEQGIQAIVASAWNEHKPYSSFISAFWKLKSNLSPQHVDIIHSHSEFGDIVAILIKLLYWNTIILRTSHGGHSVEWRKRPLRRILLTNLLYPIFFNLEIGINQATTDYLNQRWIGRKLGKKAIRIPNALDLNRFSKPSDKGKFKREAFSISNDSFVIGSVGRLTEQKGFKYLLEASEIVFKKTQKMILLIAGEGELKDDLELLAKRLGIHERVRLIGARSNIEEIYSCFDIFVNSSLWEGLPTVILESMAAGIPVIATDIPGNREFITDRMNGLLVPPGDVEKMAFEILELYSHPSSRTRLVEGGRRTIESFRIDTIARRHENLYWRLTSGYLNSSESGESS